MFLLPGGVLLSSSEWSLLSPSGKTQQIPCWINGNCQFCKQHHPGSAGRPDRRRSHMLKCSQQDTVFTKIGRSLKELISLDFVTDREWEFISNAAKNSLIPKWPTGRCPLCNVIFQTINRRSSTRRDHMKRCSKQLYVQETSSQENSNICSTPHAFSCETQTTDLSGYGANSGGHQVCCTSYSKKSLPNVSMVGHVSRKLAGSPQGNSWIDNKIPRYFIPEITVEPSTNHLISPTSYFTVLPECFEEHMQYIDSNSGQGLKNPLKHVEIGAVESMDIIDIETSTNNDEELFKTIISPASIAHHVECLRPKQLLTGETISAYLQYLSTSLFCQKRNIYLGTPYVRALLELHLQLHKPTNTSQNRTESLVLQETKGWDTVPHKAIFVNNHNSNHWNVHLYNISTKEIHFYCSLNWDPPTSDITMYIHYLGILWPTLVNLQWSKNIKVEQCSQQPNIYDCGIYALMNVKRIILYGSQSECLLQPLAINQRQLIEQELHHACSVEADMVEVTNKSESEFSRDKLPLSASTILEQNANIKDTSESQLLDGLIKYQSILHDNIQECQKGCKTVDLEIHQNSALHNNISVEVSLLSTSSRDAFVTIPTRPVTSHKLNRGVSDCIFELNLPTIGHFKSEDDTSPNHKRKETATWPNDIIWPDMEELTGQHANPVPDEMENLEFHNAGIYNTCRICCTSTSQALHDKFSICQVQFPTGSVVEHSIFSHLASILFKTAVKPMQLRNLIEELFMDPAFQIVAPILDWASLQFLGLHRNDIKFLYSPVNRDMYFGGEPIGTLLDIFCLSAILFIEFYIITTDELLLFLISKIIPSDAIRQSKEYFVVSFWQFPNMILSNSYLNIRLRQVWLFAANVTTIHKLQPRPSINTPPKLSIPEMAIMHENEVYISSHQLRSWINENHSHLTTLSKKGIIYAKQPNHTATSLSSASSVALSDPMEIAAYHESSATYTEYVESSLLSEDTMEYSGVAFNTNNYTFGAAGSMDSYSEECTSNEMAEYKEIYGASIVSSRCRDETDHLSLSDVNGTQFYTWDTQNEVTCHSQAWIPTHRLCFEKTANEFKKQCYADSQKLNTEYTYDIDAIKGCVKLEDLALALDTDIEVFTFLTLQRKIRKDNKFQIHIPSSSTCEQHKYWVPISNIPNIQIGWTLIPHIGKAAIYLTFIDYPHNEFRKSLHMQDLLRIQDSLICGFQLACTQQTHNGCIFGTNLGKGSIHSFRNSVPQCYEARSGGELRTIHTTIVHCFVNAFSLALSKHHFLGKPTIYIRAIGTKHLSTCNSIEAAQDLLQQVSSKLHVAHFKPLIIDVAVRRWDSFVQPSTNSTIPTTTWIKYSSLQMHDKDGFPGYLYSIGLTHDLNNFQARYKCIQNCATCSQATSERGQFQRANFYSTIHERLHDVKGMVLHGSPRLAVAWAIHNMLPGLTHAYKAKVKDLATTVSNFDVELNTARIRINEIKFQNNGYRFELTVPFEFGYGTMIYLDRRARNNNDFWILPSQEVGLRLELLVLQIKNNIMHILKGATYNKSNLMKLAISEDILRNALFFGRCWGGLSGMHSALKLAKFFQYIQQYNLPLWEIIQYDKQLNVSPHDFEQLLQKIAREICIPQHLNVRTLLHNGGEIGKMRTLYNKLEKICECYSQDLCTYLQINIGVQSPQFALMQRQSLDLTSPQLGILLGVTKSPAMNVTAAIHSVMNTANLSIPGWKQPYLILLQSLELQLPNCKDEMVELLAKIFVEKKIRLVHNAGTDRFWRMYPKLQQVVIDDTIRQEAYFSIPMNTIGKIVKPSRTKQKAALTRGQVQHYRAHQHRILWDEEETVRLCIGFKRYEKYKTKWAKISVDEHLGFFNYRTNENLKDRWSWLLQEKNKQYREKMERIASQWDQTKHWSLEKQSSYKAKFNI